MWVMDKVGSILLKKIKRIQNQTTERGKMNASNHHHDDEWVEMLAYNQTTTDGC